MMLLWASESCTIRSPGPNKWPIVDSFVAWPPTKQIAVVDAVKLGQISCSSSRWIGLLARNQPAGGDAGAVAVDRFLGGLRRSPDRPTCPGSCSVVKADQLAAVDVGRVAGDRLRATLKYGFGTPVEPAMLPSSASAACIRASGRSR